MTGYTKLFQTIVTSTLWRESPETKVVWVTMMALADKHGIVEASIPGLAALSHVSIEDCEAALALFLSPDKYSRTPDNEGRRIAEIPGGWELLNHEKYRLKMTDDERREYERVRKQRQRDRERKDAAERPKVSPKCPEVSPTCLRHVPTFRGKGSNSTDVPHSKADAKADADTKNPPAPPGGSAGKPRRGAFSIFDLDLPFASEPFRSALADWEQHRRESGKPLKPTGAREQLTRMAEWGEARAIAAIRHSAANGWQGLFEPSVSGKPAQAPAPKYTSDTGPKERALKEREKQLRDELPDEAQTAAMLAKLAEKFPTQRT